MSPRFVILLGLFGVLAALPLPAGAQTLGGVFGPAVKEGTEDVQYRLSWVEGENGKPDRYGHRLHWQRALNTRRMIRLITAASGPSGDVEATSLDVQLFQELTPEGPRTWRSGIRIDLSAGLHGRANAAGLHWTNEFDLGNRWSARAVAMSGVQFGEGARDGVFLQSRFRLNRGFSGGRNAGIEVFDSYGSADNFGSFNDQNHRAGPYVSLPLTGGWSVQAGALFGLSGGAADQEARLWLGRAF